MHVGRHDAHYIVYRAGDRHALDDLRPLAHDLFELLQVFARGERQLDVGHNFEVQTELVVVEQRHATGDDALFLHALDAPPARAGGEADLLRNLGNRESGLALDEVENLRVDRVQVRCHYFPPFVQSLDDYCGYHAIRRTKWQQLPRVLSNNFAVAISPSRRRTT